MPSSLYPAQSLDPLTPTPILPFEPLYDFPTTAALIPGSLRYAKYLTKRYKHELGAAIYRRDQRGRRHRLFRASDIMSLRARALVGPGTSDPGILTLKPTLTAYVPTQPPNDSAPAQEGPTPADQRAL